MRRSGAGGRGSERADEKVGTGEPIQTRDRKEREDPSRRGSGAGTGRPIRPMLKTENADPVRPADRSGIRKPEAKKSGTESCGSEWQKL